MSWEQGPRYTGMRATAIAAGHRQCLGLNHSYGTEATA